MLQQSSVLALDHLEPADAAADVDAHLLGVFGRYFKTGVLQGEVSRRHGELDEAPHFLDLFFLDVVPGVEAFHLARDAARKCGSVELGDRSNARLSGADQLPGHFCPYPERRHKTDAGHYHSSRQPGFPRRLTSCSSWLRCTRR